MDRQIVLHDTNAGGVGIMDVDEFAHAVCVVYGGAAVCHLDVAPATMRVEGNEEIDGAVAAVLVIVALAPSPLGWNRLGAPAHEGGRGVVGADQPPGGVPRPRAEGEHGPPPGGGFARGIGGGPPFPPPRL